MTELFELLRSPAWWIGVVFVSLLINVLSIYIKSPIDALLSSVSRRWAARSEATRENWTSDVRAAVMDERLQRLYFARETRHRQREIIWAIFACLGILVSAKLSSPPIVEVRYDFNVRWVSLFIFVCAGFSAVKNRLQAEIWAGKAEAAVKIAHEIEEERVAREIDEARLALKEP